MFPVIIQFTTKLSIFKLFIVLVTSFSNPLHCTDILNPPTSSILNSDPKLHNLHDEMPIMVAHGGDKDSFPEHTLLAYDQALKTDVQFVEPDLVLTKDLVLVCRHELTLKEDTDVAEHPEFAHLMRKNSTYLIDAINQTFIDNWFISDFTHDQLTKLKVYHYHNESQIFGNLLKIATFQEYIDAVHKDTYRRMMANDTFVMGMIPELKHPNYHNVQVFKKPYLIEDLFLEALQKNGYLDNPPRCQYNGTVIPCSPMVVQCFDVNTIEYLSVRTNLRLMTLFDFDQYAARYLTYKGMSELEGKSEYIAFWKEFLFTGTQAELEHWNISYDSKEIERLGGFVEPEKIVEYAHGLGFKVGIFTIYPSSKNSKRGCAKQCLNDTKETELNYYFDMGVDAFFIEGIHESLNIRDSYFVGNEGKRKKGE